NKPRSHNPVPMSRSRAMSRWFPPPSMYPRSSQIGVDLTPYCAARIPSHSHRDDFLKLFLFRSATIRVHPRLELSYPCHQCSALSEHKFPEIWAKTPPNRFLPCLRLQKNPEPFHHLISCRLS